MSKKSHDQLSMHSFAWRRAGLAVGLSLLATPLTCAVTPLSAHADEVSSSAQAAVVSLGSVQVGAEESVIMPAADEAGEPVAFADAVVTQGADVANATETAAPVALHNDEVPAADMSTVAIPEEETSAHNDAISPEESDSDKLIGTSDSSEDFIANELTPPLVEAATESEKVVQEQSSSTAHATSDQTIPAITILYDANSGDDVVKTDVMNAGSVVLPSADSLSMKAPAGTVFGGWYVPTTETVRFYKAGDTLTLTADEAHALLKEKAPVTLYALWLDPDQQEDVSLDVVKTPVFFTSLSSEGGTLSDEVVYVPDSHETIMDSVVAQPTTGYTFAGWYKDGKKISDDPVLDPTTIDGVISTDEVSAHPAVICARFIPDSEEQSQDFVPDLSAWRDPDSSTRAQDSHDQASDDGDEGPTPQDPHDDRNTDKDTVQDPSMNDPELIDQAAQSLDDPKFDENATQISEPADDVLATDPTDPTDPAHAEEDENKTGTATPSAYTANTTTGSTTKTTPYNSYSHYTASTTTPYKSTYSSTSGTSSYSGSTYNPASTSSTYNAARNVQLAQTSDNAFVALIVFIAGFVIAAAGIIIMTLRNRSHK